MEDKQQNEVTDSWFPPPIIFPDEVKSAFKYFDEAVSQILKTPPLLAGAAMQMSLEGEPAELRLALKQGQDALGAGKVSHAREILEPLSTRHMHAAALTGLCLFALGRYHWALHHFDVLTRTIPENAKPNLYQSLINIGRWIVRTDEPMFDDGDSFLVDHGHSPQDAGGRAILLSRHLQQQGSRAVQKTNGALS